jgi:hypothetical protein
MERSEVRKFLHKFVRLHYIVKTGRIPNDITGTVRGIFKYYIIFHVNDDDVEMPIRYENITSIRLSKRK